jgi:4-amino-4-deoxy-L-arabinose transferase-like glycosyltransferase
MSHMNAPGSSSTREALVIAVLTLVGAVLRVWAFGRVSLTHFDEGIYAFAGLWGLSRHGLLDLDPGVIAYAPPGLPILVGLAYLLFGVSDYAAIGVSIVAGIATVPVVGWLGRRTFGPGAGAAAATFAALSMAHVAFSRKALTDAPFLLAWLVAVGMGMRFLERPRFVRALALGAAVGIAQNFKYNGWLSGVIVAAAAAAGVLFQPDERRHGPLLRTFGWGLVAALVAALTYAPWYAFVAAHGGYADLIRHHRGYMNSRWWSNFCLQLGQANALSGGIPSGTMSGLLGGIAQLWVSGPPRRRLRDYVGTGVFAVFYAFQAYFAWWVGLGWTPWLLAQANPGLRVVGAWWLVLSLITPFYHPYARLWLPMHALGWLLAAGILSVVAFQGHGAIRTRRERRALVGIAFACGVTAGIHLALGPNRTFSWKAVLKPAPSLRDVAFQILPQRIPKGSTIRLYARRPLAFYLSIQNAYKIQLEPSHELAWKEQPEGSWGVIDELMPGGRELAWLTPNGFYFQRLPIDPITILDDGPWQLSLVGIKDSTLMAETPPRNEPAP